MQIHYSLGGSVNITGDLGDNTANVFTGGMPPASPAPSNSITITGDGSTPVRDLLKQLAAAAIPALLPLLLKALQGLVTQPAPAA